MGSLKVQKGKSGKINTNKNGKTQEKLAFKKHFQYSRLCSVDTACAHACKIWVKETETTTCRNPSIFHRHVINWIKKQQQKIPKKTSINMYPPKKINHSNLYEKTFIPILSHPRISSTFTFSASNAKALVLGPIGAKSPSVSELGPKVLRVTWSSFFSSSSNLGVMWRVGSWDGCVLLDWLLKMVVFDVFLVFFFKVWYLESGGECCWVSLDKQSWHGKWNFIIYCLFGCGGGVNWWFWKWQDLVDLLKVGWLPMVQ